MEVDGVIEECRVKATFKLGSEAYCVDAIKGSTISEELVSLKEKSMSVLKEFITKHNVPNDVPDELVDNSSENEDDDGDNVLDKPSNASKSKKTKLA